LIWDGCIDLGWLHWSGMAALIWDGCIDLLQPLHIIWYKWPFQLIVWLVI